jgi:hypothetical protein
LLRRQAALVLGEGGGTSDSDLGPGYAEVAAVAAATMQALERVPYDSVAGRVVVG